jgi:dolichol-phosphate mannosyltransferase
MAACLVSSLANVGVATYLFESHTNWILTALAGALLGAVWNYAITQLYTGGRSSRLGLPRIRTSA